MFLAVVFALSVSARNSQHDTAARHDGFAAPNFHFADFDLDGLPDLYVVRSSGDRLFKNLGDGTYGDVTDAVGLAPQSASRIAMWHDIDADGWTDLLVAPSLGGLRLWRNDRGRVFVDATDDWGLPRDAGVVHWLQWLDFDADGNSDLHVSSERGDALLRREGSRLKPATLPGVAPFDDAVIYMPTRPPLEEAQGTEPTNAPMAVGNRCPQQIKDQSTGVCIDARSTPTLGALYPLSTNLNVSAGGNVGIGTSSPGAKLDVNGSVRASGQLVSTQATGTAPLSVDSTTKVTNLNADQLDGLDSSSFSQLGASIESSEINNGTIADIDVSATAAIAGTKIAADFGGQDIVTTGQLDTGGMRVLGGFYFEVLGGVAANEITSGQGGTISGGGGPAGPNRVTDTYGTIGGGQANLAGSDDGNAVTATGATVGGGYYNHATAHYATVPGGYLNRAAGESSFAAGRFASADHSGAFVWSDGTGSIASTASNQFIVRASGGVGIGTAAPEALLHVLESSAGVVTANPNSIAVLERSAGGWLSILGGDGNSKGILFGNTTDPNSGGIVYDQSSVAANAMQFRTGGNSTRMLIDASGNVGIGTNSPSFLLHVAGSAGKPGGGSWSVASDARLKKNVADLGGSLEKLLRLRGVEFEYRDPASIGEREGVHAGFIAQEVEDVFPEWVEEKTDGTKYVSVSGFEALTVEALREVAAENRALRAELARQARELAELRSEGGANANRPATEGR